MRNSDVIGQRARFLDRDPVPPSLRGKAAQVEQVTQRSVVVWAGGIRRSVPKGWLVFQGSNTPAPPDLAVAQPAGPEAEGEDGPITEQAWYRLLDICLELNLSQEDAYQVIAEAAGVTLDELDPSRLTWRQYLQAIERLEHLEATP